MIDGWHVGDSKSFQTSDADEEDRIHIWVCCNMSSRQYSTTPPPPHYAIQSTLPHSHTANQASAAYTCHPSLSLTRFALPPLTRHLSITRHKPGRSSQLHLITTSSTQPLHNASPLVPITLLPCSLLVCVINCHRTLV